MAFKFSHVQVDGSEYFKKKQKTPLRDITSLLLSPSRFPKAASSSINRLLIITTMILLRKLEPVSGGFLCQKLLPSRAVPWCVFFSFPFLSHFHNDISPSASSPRSPSSSLWNRNEKRSFSFPRPRFNCVGGLSLLTAVPLEVFGPEKGERRGAATTKSNFLRTGAEILP